MNQSLKRLSLSLLLAISFFKLPLLESSYEVIQDQMVEKIRTPSLQNVTSEKMRLANGLEVLIISDPETPKSGAALAVGVGNAHEPQDKLGLAHFVEHMLFLGTQKYPQEKEYHEFIQENGGANNAYTTIDRTVYMYEINNAQMSEALDRFGSFFSSPLFSSSGLSRERLAVDQEFSHRSINDGLRTYLVFLNQFQENHQLNVWRCGTKETLEQISRDELVEWYQSHYGADRMKLVVYSNQSIDVMREQVDQIFSQVPQSKASLQAVNRPLVDQRNKGRWIYVKPLKDVRMLNLFWEVDPKYVRDFQYHTSDLIGEILSEENATSLSTYLKKEGLIQNLSAGDFNFTSDVGFFHLSMNLTEQGVVQKDRVIEKVFEALQGLRQEGVPRYRFEEKVNMAKLKYEYQSRPNVFEYLTSASADLLEEPLATYPSKHYWPSEFSQERNQAFLESLKPSEAIYLLTASESLTNQSFDQVESVAQVEYTSEEISKKQLQALSHVRVQSDIGPPPPNPYIPDHVVLVDSSSSVSEPQLLTHEDKGRMYFLGDQKYFVPECAYTVRIHSPNFLPSASCEVLKDLFISSLADATAEQGDQGSIAGLHHTFNFNANFALNVQVYGYSQKSKVYLTKLLEKVKTHTPTQAEFNRYKEHLLVQYENAAKKMPPLQQATEVVSSLIIKEHISAQEKLEAIKALKYEDALAFHQSAFDQVYLNTFFYGNLKEGDAKDMYELLSSFFASSEAYPESELQRRSVLELDKQFPPQYVARQTEVEGNAVCLMINHGEMTFPKMAALNVFANSVSTSFFDTLRTKQQTGYVVQSASKELERQLYSFYMVLSNSHSTRDLLARFELFHEEFLKGLNSQDYTEEKFLAIKQSIITELEQPPKSLLENGARLVNYAFDYQGDFHFHEKQIAALKALTYEEFLSFAMEQFGRGNSRRFAALVNGKLAAGKQFEYVPIENFKSFKSQLYYTSADIISQHDFGEDHGI